MSSGSAGIMAARRLHARPSLAARGFTRRRWQCPETGRPGTFSSPLPFPPVTCKKKKTKPQQPVDFSCFFVCRFAFLPSLFSSLPNLELSLVACAANRPDVWMAGSATSLFLLHFYTGGVAHRCHGCEIGAHPNFGFLPLLHYPLAFLLISSLSL